MKFKVGDLVWAKMKGYSSWPGKIIIPPKGLRRPKTKKVLHFVYFYGSNNYGWVGSNNIVFHNSDLVNKALGKSGPRLRRAVEAIQFESQKEAIYTDSDDDECPVLQDTSINNWKEFPDLRTCSVAIKRLNLNIKEARISEYCFSSRMIEEGNMEGPRPSEIRNRSPSVSSDEIQIIASCSSNSVQSRSVRVGVVGLGKIGAGLARNFMKKGFLVTLWNRSPEGLEDLVRGGALIARSPADTVITCSVTFCCLPDVEDVTRVLYEEGGILNGLDRCIGMRKGYVGLSMCNVEYSVKIAQEIKAKGGRYLEAPVLGSDICCGNGNAIVLASGDQSLFTDFEPCFNAFSKPTYLGPNSGYAIKVNTVISLFLGSFSVCFNEAKSLIKQFGLETTRNFDLLLRRYATMRESELYRRDFDPQDPIQDFLKALDLKVLLAGNFPGVE